jgi:hypothetical protein
MIIEVAFGGLVKEQSIHKWLWGYNDTFVKTIHYQPILLGGDPSVNFTIHINDINVTHYDIWQRNGH